ncbi:MAG: DUF748 domain-containing protein [Bacteroidia bacterium]
MKIRKRFKVLGVIVLILIIGRLTLPYFVARYVNKVLSEIPGYYGKIDDVDIHLLSGSYQINGLELKKVENNTKFPFLDIPQINLSVEWPALVQGKIVAEIFFIKPVVNFEKNEEPKIKKDKKQVDWTEPLKRLVPVKINKLRIREGNVAFRDFESNPKINLVMTNIELQATNLSNANKSTDPLPSHLELRAGTTTMGSGKLSLSADLNVLKPIPDFDADLKYEEVDLTAFNDMFLAYGNVDVEKGRLFIYSEAALIDSSFDGYVKPIIKELNFLDLKEKPVNPGKIIREATLNLIAGIFKNRKAEQFAAKAPFEGKISDVNMNVWSSVWSVWRNAFVKAFDMNTDNSISIADDALKQNMKQ